MINRRKIFTAAIGAALSVVSVFFVACTEPAPDDEDKKTDVKTICYSDYGAVGDGKTDDFKAIKSAHEDANKNGYKVTADDNATYYIGEHAETVSVKTDTDWGNATFIIDDTEITYENRGWYVFEVSPDVASKKVNVPKNLTLKKGQTNIGLTFDTNVMLRVVNNKKKDYIRYGKNTNNGSDRQEIILVDKDGNIDEQTPLLWDYDAVTSITQYSVNEKPLTIEGGTFYTLANTQPVSSNYYARGIMVKRSNTTLFGIKHYIQGEGAQSSPYTGFYVVNDSNNVTIESCLLTGHTTYTNIKPTGAVSQGTYDTQAVRSNNVKWLNCTQSNDVTDTTYWGVMASNFCKNLNMEGCNLSRFDAHQGVYNATIKNTVLGQNLTIIGAGTLLLDGVQRMSGDHFLELRQDYGSTWEGDVIIKNSSLKTTSDACSVIQASCQDWNFGYTCYMPKNVILENFQVFGSNKAYVFSVITGSKLSAVQSSKNPYVITETVTITDSGSLQLTLNKSGLLDGVIIK